MNDKPLILITNDDGIYAPGVSYLAEYVADMADVIIVCPDRPQSGMSSAITVGSPLKVTAHPDRGAARVFSVSGTPVDCVKIAMHNIVPRKPDMILSGINHGSNSGTAITYSGTMGAVLEGCMIGIPSIGFSLLHHSLKADFSMSKPFIREIVSTALATPPALLYMPEREHTGIDSAERNSGLPGGSRTLERGIFALCRPVGGAVLLADRAICQR